LLYSAGAVLNLMQWPVLSPGIFGAHELFHLFVMAGSIAHYWFILTVVVPFQPGAAEVSASSSAGGAGFADEVGSGRASLPANKPVGRHHGGG
jgi:hypothetical protein